MTLARHSGVSGLSTTRAGYDSPPQQESLKVIYAILHWEGYLPRQAPNSRMRAPVMAVEIPDDGPDYTVVSGTPTEVHATE
jgi:hypothetical protein